MKTKNYGPTKRMTREEAIANPQPVCVLVNGDGKPEGVLVQALDDKFVIDTKDFNDGEWMSWEKAVSALKEAGKTTFTRQQAFLVLYLIDAINAALSSVGGDELANIYWVATEYSLNYAWYVNLGSSLFIYTYKYSALVVRAVEAFWPSSFS